MYGMIVATLNAPEIGKWLAIRDEAAVPGRLGAAQGGILYVQSHSRSQRAPSTALRTLIIWRRTSKRYLAGPRPEHRGQHHVVCQSSDIPGATVLFYDGDLQDDVMLFDLER